MLEFKKSSRVRYLKLDLRIWWMNSRLAKVYDVTLPHFFFKKIILFNCNRKNQLLYNLNLRIRTWSNRNLLFHTITTIYNMIYVLWNLTRDVSVFIMEILEQSSCMWYWLLFTLNYHVFVLILSNYTLWIQYIVNIMHNLKKCGYYPTLIGVPVYVVNKYNT